MPLAATACSTRRLRASTPLPVASTAASTLASAVASTVASTSRRAFLRGSAGVLLFSGVGSTLLTACGGGNLNADQPETPRLASVNNFRDVAGAAAGYPTVDGKQMRRGAFYRSNALTLSEGDQVAIDKLGIASVYDLRTPGEISLSSDTLPTGAVSQSFNVLGTNCAMVPMLQTPANAVAFMERQMREYVTGGAQRMSFGALFKALANGAGVQLFHSSAGKDRAGWVSAVLLSIANVPLDVIMQDYLMSNVYSAQSIKAQAATLRVHDGDAVATIQAPLLGVQESYLQAGFDQVQASYGTMSNYLSEGLGLGEETVGTLRSRLVV